MERYWFLGTLQVLKVDPVAVGGRFSLVDALFPHHASPPMHTHPQDETFIVVEGHLTAQAGDERFDIGPGDVAAFPGGTAHSFVVRSESARVFILSTPAGIERLFVEGGVPATADTLPPPDTPRPAAGEMERVFRDTGVENVGPPLLDLL